MTIEDFDPSRLRRIFGRNPSHMPDVLKSSLLMKVIVSADGLGEAPVQALIAHQRDLGIPAAFLPEIEAFDPRGRVPEDYMPASVAPGTCHARMLVYAMVYAALSDRVYSPGERAVIERLAARIAVTPAMLALIEGLVRSEQAAESIRMALFDDGLVEPPPGAAPDLHHR